MARSVCNTLSTDDLLSISGLRYNSPDPATIGRTKLVEKPSHWKKLVLVHASHSPHILINRFIITMYVRGQWGASEQITRGSD